MKNRKVVQYPGTRVESSHMYAKVELKLASAALRLCTESKALLYPGNWFQKHMKHTLNLASNLGYRQRQILNAAKLICTSMYPGSFENTKAQFETILFVLSTAVLETHS